MEPPYIRNQVMSYFLLYFSSEIFNLEEANFQSEIFAQDKILQIYREFAVYLVDIDFCRT